MISLNPKFEIQYIEKAKRIDEDFGMNLALTAERYGFQQGMQEGEGTMLMYLLERKFKNIPDIYRYKIKQADTQTLLKWAERVLEYQAIEDVFK